MLKVSEKKKVLNIAEGLELSLDSVIGKSIAILGIRGSGKTNTAAVIIEELLKYNFPVAIIDIDGEYWGLKEKYEILVVGKGNNVDIELDVIHSEAIAKFFVEKGIPVILDFSNFLMNEIYQFLVNFFKVVWELSGKLRKPSLIVIEEAHEFIPQGIKTELKEYIARVALRGRKRGISLLIISQRSAKVDKDTLTQCEILFLHKVIHPVDLNVYKALLPLPSRDVEGLVSELQVGESIFYNGKIIQKVRIRKRYTYHAGYTPSFKVQRIPHLKSVSKEIIEELKRIAFKKRKEESLLEKLQAENEKLKAIIVEKDKEIQKLKEQIDLLSKLKLEISPHIITKNIFDKTPSNNIKREEERDISGILEHQDIKKHISRLLTIIQKLPKPTKSMLSFLVEREPNEYTYSQIASWLNYRETTLRKNPPTLLLRLGIIAKRKKGRKITFSSNLKTFVKNEFNIYVNEGKIIDDSLYIIYSYLKKQISNLSF